MMDKEHREDSLKNAESGVEQNYNMVGDGLINNLPTPRADLTDGQTHEELLELAPETLPETRQSLLELLRSWEDTLAEGQPEPAAHEQREEGSL